VKFEHFPQQKPLLLREAHFVLCPEDLPLDLFQLSKGLHTLEVIIRYAPARPYQDLFSDLERRENLQD